MATTSELFTRYEEAILKETRLRMMASVACEEGKSFTFLEAAYDTRKEIRDLRAELIRAESQVFLETAVCLHRGGLSYQSACDAAHMICHP